MTDASLTSRDGGAAGESAPASRWRAGRGLEAAFVTAYGLPTRCCACPARRAHNICPGKPTATVVFWDQNVSDINDLLLRKRSYATCRCCMNLPLQVRAM